MAFMTVLLLALVGVAVWVYFRTNPLGVAWRALGLYNGAVLLGALAAAVLVGRWLYLDALVVKGGQAGLPVYLSVMAASTVLLVVLVLGGVARNFFVFPAGTRRPGA